MANIRKSFNFRTGLQVDNDNFVVNSNGLVGIGTSIPSGYLLNVYGDTRVTGLVTTNLLQVTGIGTFAQFTASNANVVGIVTAAQLQLGGGEIVDNIIGFARTTFITDNGGVGLHTSSKVGINTTSSPGGSDVEFTVAGNVSVTGVLTATTFTGSGANLTSIPNSATTADSGNTASTIVARDAGGNFSAGTITAALSGTATTASSITESASITVSQASVGVLTATTRARIDSLGIGTDTAFSQLHVRKTGISSISVTSDGDNEAIINVGRNISPTTDGGQIRYGHGNSGGSFPQSTDASLDFINYATGNVNFYLNPSGLGTAFNFMTNGSNRAMVLTQAGNLGIDSTTPTEKLDVIGNVSVSGIISATTIEKVDGTSSQFLKADGSVDSNTYLTTTGDGSSLTGVVTSIVAGTNITVQDNTVSSTQDFVGVVTAAGGFTSGTGDPVVISVSGSTLTFTVGGASTSLTLV